MKVHTKTGLTFKDFLENRKKKGTDNSTDTDEWEIRKNKWIESVENLYQQIDEIIIGNFKNAGYQVTTKKEEVRIFEEYIGSYKLSNYIINADDLKIKFYPIGTILIGAFGRVNMVLPQETVKIILQNWDEWKIVSGFGSSMKLVDFNEENIFKIFQDNL